MRRPADGPPLLGGGAEQPGRPYVIAVVGGGPGEELQGGRDPEAVAEHMGTFQALARVRPGAVRVAERQGGDDGDEQVVGQPPPVPAGPAERLAVGQQRRGAVRVVPDERHGQMLLGEDRGRIRVTEPLGLRDRVLQQRRSGRHVPGVHQAEPQALRRVAAVQRLVEPLGEGQALPGRFGRRRAVHDQDAAVRGQRPNPDPARLRVGFQNPVQPVPAFDRLAAAVPEVVQGAGQPYRRPGRPGPGQRHLQRGAHVGQFGVDPRGPLRLARAEPVAVEPFGQPQVVVAVPPGQRDLGHPLGRLP